MRATSPPIPVIDLTADDEVHLAAAVGAACRDTGLFLVTGHGIDADLVGRMEDVSRAFFALADVAKRRSRSPSGNPFLGWACSEVDTSAGRVRFQEQFEVSRFDTPDDVRAAGYGPEWVARAEPNVWPEHPAALEPTWTAYLAAMDELGARLLRFLARALALPPDWFEPAFTRPASYLAANLYHPVADGIPDGLRLLEHTDLGALTVLHQDDGPGGLQCRDRGGRWLEVPAVPGTFVVNLGDLLAMWTNDRWTATRHRVVACPSGERRSRLSIPYFLHADLDAVVECAPTCTSPADPPRWPRVVAGEWTRARMAAAG